MRTECLNYRYSHDDALPVSRLITDVGNKMQVCTQRYDRRPYGVGLLVAGYDVCHISLIYLIFFLSMYK